LRRAATAEALVDGPLLQPEVVDHRGPSGATRQEAGTAASRPVIDHTPFAKPVVAHPVRNRSNTAEERVELLSTVSSGRR
jgi:hypothetical protein